MQKALREGNKAFGSGDASGLSDELQQMIAGQYRLLVSMGAVGAIAPTVFESVGASTHVFWSILLQLFMRKGIETTST